MLTCTRQVSNSVPSPFVECPCSCMLPPACSRACLWLFDAACVALDASYSLTKYALHAYDQWQTAAAEARGEVRIPTPPSNIALCCAACVVFFTHQLRCCRPLYAAGAGGVGGAHLPALLAAALHPPHAQRPHPGPLFSTLVRLNAVGLFSCCPPHP